MALQRITHTGAAPPTGLASPISASALSLALTSGTGYPTGAGGPFVIDIDAATPSEEKILCSSLSGGTITVAAGGRGYDGTAPAAHNGGTNNVTHVITSAEADDANAHIYVPTRDDHTQYVRTDGSRSVTGNLTIAGGLNVGGDSNVGGKFVAPTVGANAAGGGSRFVGEVTFGPPTTGTWAGGDFITDVGNVCIWLCTVGGTPGTWVKVGGGTTPAAMHAYNSSSQSIPANTTTLVHFNTVTVDTAGGFNPGGNAYVTPHAGNYLVQAQVYLIQTTGSAATVVLLNGGSTAVGQLAVPIVDVFSLATVTVPFISRMDHFNSGDSIAIGVASTVATTTGVDTTRLWFTVQEV